MPRIAEEQIRKRLERIKLLLERHGNGLTESEIAEKLGFETRTTHNYLRTLEFKGHIYKEGKYWLADHIEPLKLRNPELEPEEAIILYLASRLFVKQTDRRNEVAESALLKLAQVLSRDAHLGDDLYQAAEVLAQRLVDTEHQNSFEVIVRGYLYRRKLEITYHPYRGNPFTTLFAPYLIEPSAIGFATYAVGHSSLPDKLRTYKLERIASAKITREEYTVPPDFPGLELLANAWSIYYGEETTQVILRFAPDVARRVQESNWHPSQQMAWDEQLPGYLLISFDVADTTDLKPWIRTWGANCEVLAPDELRDELTGEARRWAELYGWHTAQTNHKDDDDPLGLENTLGNFFS